MPKLKPETAEKRKAQIVRAALRCFSARGFHKTSMPDLYQEAGVSAGSFYSWFKGKEDLIEAAYAANSPRATALIEQLTEERAVHAFAKLIRMFAEKFRQPDWRDESRVNVQIWAEALTNDRMRAAFITDFDRYRAILAGAVRRDQNLELVSRRIDPAAAAQVVWSLVIGLEAQKAWDPELDEEAYAEAAAALFTGEFTTGKGGKGRAMSDRNKEVVRDFVAEVINGKRIEGAKRYFADHYEHHSPQPGLPPGYEGFRVVHEMLCEAFPDLEVTIEELIAEGATVMGRTRWRGTHLGPFMGKPATGRQIDFEMMEVWYLEGDLFAGHRGFLDRASLLDQLSSP